MKRPYAFHVMVKPIGPICNLACEYCYYLPKETLYPDTSDFRMSDALLESFIQQYIEGQDIISLNFGWQGGEPTLLGVDFFDQVIKYQHRYRKPRMQITNALQTNGSLLDDEWGRFLKEHNFLVGLSLDGPRALHDAYRHDKGGGPTFDQVMSGLKVLKRHNVEFNILTAVHDANVSFPLEIYRFLRDEVGTRFMQFIPIVERVSEGTTTRSVTANQYGDFLKAIFDEWVRNDLGQVSVQIFEVALFAWLGQPSPLCVFAETCGNAMVLEHNGDLYSCDHFVTPQHYLGNITETPLVELAKSVPQRTFGQVKARLPQVCQDCDVRFVCHGGCPKNRIVRPGSSDVPLNILCEGYKLFFRHIDRSMRIIAWELNAGTPPEQIRMKLLRDAARLEQACAQTGRNDPCPCGSGKKFKHCHGKRS